MSEENAATNLEDNDESGGATDPSSESDISTAENAAGESGTSPSENEAGGVAVTAVERPEIDVNAPVDGPTADLSMILDIPVTLSMEIGQTRISISDLLKLGKDSVIELQRMADEPMDVLVNGTLVARGEAVVVGERFGIRLTDVVSPQERLKQFT